MDDQQPTAREQRELYERVYSDHDERNQRWKELLAEANIGPLEQMLRHADVAPQTVIDVGCGDGSILEQMSRRGIGTQFIGYEIAPAAVSYVRSRNIPGLEAVHVFDGSSVPEADDSFDLGLLHFVIDQAITPDELLRELRRVARHVLVSVMLDDTARTRGRLQHGESGRFGRIQMYNRDSIRAQLQQSGLRIVADDIRPPSMPVAVFWAAGAVDKSRAYALAAARIGLHRLAPRRAQRLFGHAYRAICDRA